MKKIVGLILLVALLAAGCTTGGDQATPTPTPTAVPTTGETPAATETPVPSYTDLPPSEAKDLIDTTPDLVIIDVSPHYDAGHLPGAVHYYLGDGSLDAAIPTLDKEGIYLVYCHVDSVAIAGAQKLVDAGFINVYRLEGNYGAWVDAGYPVET
ncbi:MAG: rhodanese-like domain-containing protein [Methanomicrobiaceae archaeon]|nr:rhodanese-like domain-containing protein [Methanomicrobiaceae archaeon]